jgi:hypothetical protein
MATAGIINSRYFDSVFKNAILPGLDLEGSYVLQSCCPDGTKEVSYKYAATVSYQCTR